MLGCPRRGIRQDGVVDEDEVLGLGEGLEDEGGEEEAALRVLVAEGGEAAVGAAIGQLPLVAGDEEGLRLGHDLRLELVRPLQVLEDKGVRGEQDHVLLAAAERHLEELVQALDGLSEEAAGEGHVGAGRVGDHVLRQGHVQGAGSAGGQHHVLHLLPLDALGLDCEALDDGIGGLAATGGYLDELSTDCRRADHELGAADVVPGHRDGLGGVVQEIEPGGGFDLHQELLLRVQVVVESDLDRELLAPDGGVGEVCREEEGLEDGQGGLGDAQAVVGGEGDSPQVPGGDGVWGLDGQRGSSFAVGHDLLPDPGLREELADALNLGEALSGSGSGRRSFLTSGDGGSIHTAVGCEPEPEPGPLDLLAFGHPLVREDDKTRVLERLFSARDEDGTGN